MPPATQTIEFEDYFAEGVLGIFKIIRGFADLRDLAAVSVPYELSDGAEGITNLLNPLSPTKQLLETFKATQRRVPKRVFLARWYPPGFAG